MGTTTRGDTTPTTSPKKHWTTLDNLLARIDTAALGIEEMR